MGIYNRDNINYPGMIQNMLTNAQRGGQINADEIRKQGEIWSGAIKDLGSKAANAYLWSDMYQTDEEKLLEQKKAEAEALKAQESANAANLMKDYSQDVGMVANTNKYAEYRPNIAGNYSRAGAISNPYAIPGNPYASQDEYFKYIQAMTGIYGGR